MQLSKGKSLFKSALGTAVLSAALLSASTSAVWASSQAVTNIDAFIAQQNIDKNAAKWKLKLSKPPMQAFDQGKTYIWNLETNVGNIAVKLLPKTAPMHVTSTIYLTRLGFYDKVAFHRVITDFMAQGGDPTGTGRAGPGYTYDGEFSPSVRHDKPGLLSMANAGPGTDGSQFFLTFKATPWLDGKHTIFGEVIEGKKTLRELELAGSGSGRTSKKLEIVKASIEVK